MAGERFDSAYYERFYGNPHTRVVDAAEIDRLAGFVCAYMHHLDLPVRRVLDIGCGVGHWRRALARHHPRARYAGIEISAYLCERYGWERGSVVDYSARAPFDLVVCQGVLQYLPHRDAARAIDNLARLCRGALFLEALTREDWERNCDKRRTDGAVHLRRAAWYRRRLGTHFVACGGGVFASRRARCVLYELEKA